MPTALTRFQPLKVASWPGLPPRWAGTRSAHTMAKTVCIVGAGPSGLVAAKSLLHDAPKGTFDVTLFDVQSRIGGLWPSHKDDGSGLVHPRMVANQSRHTVQFSDLAWPEDAPQLPRAWQVGQYLARYRERYCSEAKLNLGTCVERAEPLEGSASDGSGAGWRVQLRSPEGQTREETFDYLLIASGFFGKPVIPRLGQEQASIPVLHSSQYRDLQGLLGNSNAAAGKILVVGGQMSGIEIAGTIASHLSSAAHSPGPSPIQNPDKYTIHHIIQRPAWVLPLHTTPKPASSAPPFVPLDLSSYNLANRPHPLTDSQGHISVDAAKIFHSIYENVVGTDQSLFSPTVAVTIADTDSPPYLAVSEHYMDFVRSGLITVSRGKLESLAGREATISPSGEKITEIAAVVLATGFDAASSVSFLPPSIQQTLSLDPSDLNNTVALAFHNTHHPNISSLGFVGFYRSPYWGIMEMQARFLTALWSAGGPSSPTLPEPLQRALADDISIARTLKLRTDPRASQFPMGDYPWMMQQFAAALGIDRVPPLSEMPRLPPAGKPMDILTPARYPCPPLKTPTPTAAETDGDVHNAQHQQAAEVLASLRQTEATARAGLTQRKFVARAVFRSLLGEWKLERDLVSKLPSHPSGHFSGTARFLLREGTRDGREAQWDALHGGEGKGGGGVDVGLSEEYLYVEDGEFRAANGLSFRATRRYVWRYDEARDKVSVWFVKTDDQLRADYLFHEVEFQVPPPSPAQGSDHDGQVEEESGKGWQATAGHLCIDDFYNVNYEFNFRAVNLSDWRLAYTVKGPKKDYSIDGVYTRR